MEKNYRVSIKIISIIIIGIMLSSMFVYFSYRQVIKDNTESIAELSTMNIYSEINTELTKPMYVSLTMANDSFLHQWIENETTSDVNEITTFLNGIKTKYDYNSVFLVSTDTLNYYYYDGINKVISPTDEHDVWYYTFFNSPDPYELDVDVDEVTGLLTIFVNVKVFDDFGDVIAVVGVGLEMEHIQEIMSNFEDEYNLDAYLIDDNGLVQSHSETENIESLNIFTLFDTDLKDDILIDQSTLQTTVTNDDTYIISRLIDEIDWYLVITKDTNVFSNFLMDYFLATLIMILVVITLVLYIVINSLTKYQKLVFSLAKTDYLTLLLNRRGFSQEYHGYDKSKEAMVFITDIDKFKLINDEYGHSKGDELLRRVANIINDEVNKYGKLSRWGGDEFTGFMIGERDILESVLQRIFTMIETDDELSKYNLSISLGYTYSKFDIDLDDVLSKADKALYQAKSKGGKAIGYMQ
ncbi:MAG TPA: diguanylate cyclase [Candidatus Izemoplasmatales bacterium]|nr:diguanylate cyclase [Candidatus Izemoplasmatales bacterium]